MAGLLSKIFGRGRKKDASGDRSVQAGRTHVTSHPAESGQRVVAIGQSQFSAPGRKEGTDADTGPWFVGKTVGEMFEIRGVLGRGGMGIVYRAYDTATQRDVAVKVPLGKFIEDEGARKQFVREAEAWTGLIKGILDEIRAEAK